MRWLKKKSVDGAENFDLAKEYDVIEEIGRGAYGVVQSAHKKGESMGVTVAVKILPLHASHLTAAEMRTKLARLKQLNDSRPDHSHVVTFLGFRVTEDTAFTFIEYCAGGDMLDRILNLPEERPTEEQARAAVFSLMHVLAGTHANGLLHRDIKSDNVFFRRPEDTWDMVVLGDWGCCIEGKEDEQFTGVVGTPEYCSPEMYLSTHSSKTDVWSLGVTAYMLLSGRLPWISAEIMPLREQIIGGQPITYTGTAWSTVSDEAKDCVQRMLERDPNRRSSAAQLLSHPWFQLDLSKKPASPVTKHISLDPEHANAYMPSLQHLPSTGIRTNAVLNAKPVQKEVLRRLSKLSS